MASIIDEELSGRESCCLICIGGRARTVQFQRYQSSFHALVCSGFPDDWQDLSHVAVGMSHIRTQHSVCSDCPLQERLFPPRPRQLTPAVCGRDASAVTIDVENEHQTTKVHARSLFFIEIQEVLS